MTVVPLLGESSLYAQLIYSCLFFGIALYVALHPEKLSDRLGKVLCPILLTLIAIVFIGSLFVSSDYGNATLPYQNIPLVQGFLDGYQTMDTIAALNFGIIIALNIQNKGIQDNKQIVSSTVKAGLIAGVCLTVVYCVLLHIGGMSKGMLGAHSNGAQTLSQFVFYLFKNSGLIILGSIFFIACLNTCIGLICCCSEYFYIILPRISYRAWAFLFAFISMIISNVGLDFILKISMPILNILYPLSIVLIGLSFLHRWILKYRYIYQTTILFTGIGSFIGVFYHLGIDMSFIHMIPLFDISLGWVIFSVFGFVLGLFVKK